MSVAWIQHTIHDVDTLHDDIITSLSRYILDEDLYTVNQLLALGANPNIYSHVYDADRRCWRWETPLITASRLGFMDIVKVLVAQGASFSSQDHTLGRTALHWACHDYNPEIIKYLVISGCPVNTRNYGGEPPVLEAIINKDCESVQFLLDHGVDLDISDINFDRDTALLLALSISAVSVARSLLKAGAEVMAFNRECEDAFTMLVKSYSCEIELKQRIELLSMVLYSGSHALHRRYFKQQSLLMRKLSQVEQLWNILDGFFSQPFSLKALSRTCIRQCLLVHTQRRSICGIIEHLPQPSLLKKYISYDIIH